MDYNELKEYEVTIGLKEDYETIYEDMDEDTEISDYPMTLHGADCMYKSEEEAWEKETDKLEEWEYIISIEERK